jgi:hypothetical protein
LGRRALALFARTTAEITNDMPKIHQVLRQISSPPLRNSGECGFRLINALPAYRAACLPGVGHINEATTCADLAIFR